MSIANLSIDDPRIHRRIEWLVQRANDFLPDDVALGYEIAHTHYEDDATVMPETEQVDFTNWSLRRWRSRLQQYADRGDAGASTDLAALPDDATDITGAYVLFELLHIPSGVRVIRTYALQALINLATDGTRTTEEKRQVVKTQLQSFYSDLQDRVV